MPARATSAALLAAVLLAIDVLASATGSTRKWPSVPLPDGSEGESVSRHMLYNGLHMRASKIRHDTLAPEQMIAFYRTAWRGLMVENRVAGKIILGHLDGDHYITVEVTHSGRGSAATIGVMQATQDSTPREHGKWLPRPANSEVLNDIQYLDTPGKTRSLTLRNRLTPAQNYDFYRRTLQAQGWAAPGPGCSVMVSSCSVQFNDGARRLAITLDRDRDGTLIVANQETR